MSMLGYTVAPISYDDSIPWLLEKHYAKRMPSVSFSFGLFKSHVLIGVLTIGKPASGVLCETLCGKDNCDYVYELNRVVLENNIKNEASWFMARCFRLLPKPMILVSYADKKHHHSGYIYQATNWIYTGLSAKRTDRQPIEYDGNKHSRHMRYECHEGTETVERSRKHRYVLFIGDKRQKKKFKDALVYDVLDYPKEKVIHYDTSAKIVTQMTLI